MRQAQDRQHEAQKARRKVRRLEEELTRTDELFFKGVERGSHSRLKKKFGCALREAKACQGDIEED